MFHVECLDNMFQIASRFVKIKRPEKKRRGDPFCGNREYNLCSYCKSFSPKCAQAFGTTNDVQN